nr:hypothetical protein [Pandoravirus aubagnensis]
MGEKGTTQATANARQTVRPTGGHVCDQGKKKRQKPERATGQSERVKWPRARLGRILASSYYKSEANAVLVSHHAAHPLTRTSNNNSSAICTGRREPPATRPPLPSHSCAPSLSFFSPAYFAFFLTRSDSAQPMGRARG